jgi:ABC-type cobalamin/Fe3+-siderophores transport system ATPase subunit
VVGKGPPAEAITKEVLEEIYGTHVVVGKVEGKPVIGLTSEGLKHILK